jgi:hypothetical protein
MKKFFAALPLCCVFFAACPEAGTTTTDNTISLVNSVWAGETPRAGDWLTITFKTGGKVIWAFSADNTTNEWEYTFNSSASTGSITSSGWNPAPDGFSISGNTLTITHYGSHEGSPREFKQLRTAGLTVAAVPFTPETLAADLTGSVWAGETPRTGDWLTISFKTGGKVIWAFSADNTTNEWEYTFNDDTNTGTITVSSGWNPAPDGFSISGNTLTITRYGSHEETAREFKRYR